MTVIFHRIPYFIWGHQRTVVVAEVRPILYGFQQYMTYGDILINYCETAALKQVSYTPT